MVYSCWWTDFEICEVQRVSQHFRLICFAKIFFIVVVCHCNAVAHFGCYMKYWNRPGCVPVRNKSGPDHADIDHSFFSQNKKRKGFLRINQIVTVYSFQYITLIRYTNCQLKTVADYLINILIGYVNDDCIYYTGNTKDRKALSL